MAELELIALHSDGEHLILASPDGHRHRLAIDDALRAAVRQDRPRLAQVRTPSTVRPREIQSRLRAGESPANIAADAGVPVEHIRRYEGPVTAERAWIAQEAQRIPLRREPGAPRLGDLAIDRLARRGIDLDDVRWDATRRPDEGWQLVLEFRADGHDRQARWSVDVPARTLHALDAESRWLSEADLTAPETRRHLSPVHSQVYDVEADTAEAPAAEARTAEARTAEARTADEAPAPRDAADTQAADTQAADTRTAETRTAETRTAEILEGLRATRGVRREVPRIPESEDVHWEEPEAAAATPVRSLRPVAGLGADHAPPAPAEEPAGESGQPLLPDVRPSASPARTKSRSRRTSVPSWDEIVFGAKPE